MQEILQEIIKELSSRLRKFASKKPAAAIVAGLCVLLGLLKIFSLLISLVFGDSLQNTVTIKGELQIDNSPVTQATIQFIPKKNGQPTSAEIFEGSFVAQNVPIGECRVLCIATKSTGRMINEGTHTFPEIVSAIPEQFRQGIDLVIEDPPKPLLLDWHI